MTESFGGRYRPILVLRKKDEIVLGFQKSVSASPLVWTGVGVTVPAASTLMDINVILMQGEKKKEMKDEVLLHACSLQSGPRRKSCKYQEWLFTTLHHKPTDFHSHCDPDYSWTPYSYYIITVISILQLVISPVINIQRFINEWESRAAGKKRKKKSKREGFGVCLFKDVRERRRKWRRKHVARILEICTTAVGIMSYLMNKKISQMYIFMSCVYEADHKICAFESSIFLLTCLNTFLSCVCDDPFLTT